MKTVELKSSFEKVTFDFGDGGKVAVAIDCRDDLMNALWAKFKLTQEKIAAIQEDASGVYELEELNKYSKQIADILKDTIVMAIGENSYNELLLAAGLGVAVKPEQANAIMAQVFAEISAAIVERVDSLNNNKASHYLQEVALKNKRTV